MIIVRSIETIDHRYSYKTHQRMYKSKREPLADQSDILAQHRKVSFVVLGLIGWFLVYVVSKGVGVGLGGADVAGVTVQSVDNVVMATDMKSVVSFEKIQVAGKEVKVVDANSQTRMGRDGWLVDSRCTNGRIVIVGASLGNDITWDLQAAEVYDSASYVVDPVRTSLSPLGNGEMPVLVSQGLGAREEQQTFVRGQKQTDWHVSSSTSTDREGTMEDEKAVFGMTTLRNLMSEKGHSYVDILKLDNGGLEYDILEEMVKERWFPMTQLLVRFHPDVEGQRTGRHKLVWDGLMRAGFTPFAKTPTDGGMMSWIKKQDLAYCFGDPTASRFP